MTLLKWKLMLTTLPFVAVAVIAKLVVHYAFKWEGIVDFSDVGLVLTGAVFLVGFMLSGTMADYKESEKLPGELACALENLEDSLVHAGIAKPAYDAKKGRAAARELAVTVRDWLVKKRTQTELYDAITSAQEQVFAAESAGASGQAGRAMAELQQIRKTITRIGVISRTNFLASGYALLDTLVALALMMMFVSKFKSTIAEVVLMAFVTLIFVYMVRLIRDIDDPFEYAPDGSRGAAEVELLPLDDLAERWRLS
jgi:hypothetical protein